MKDIDTGNRGLLSIKQLAAGADDPIWLLQKDDSRVLYASFFLSALVHGVMFAVMATTRIFQPFAGASAQLDLFWFTSASVSPSKARQTVNEPPLTVKNLSKIRAATKSTPPMRAARKPSAAKTTPPEKQEPVPAVFAPKAQPEFTGISMLGDQMVITRYGGKVVDLVEKTGDIPIFKPFSTVEMKSTGAKAVVRTILEEKPAPPLPLVPVAEKPVQVVKAPERIEVKRQTARKGSVKGDDAVVTASTEGARTATPPAATPFNPVQARLSSASPDSFPSREGIAAEKGPAENTRRMAAGATSNAPETLGPGKAEGGKDERSSAGKPFETKASVPAVEQRTLPSEPSVESTAKLPPAPQTEKPKAIFHPPLSGDLKLIITGEKEVKVTAFFRKYGKERRGKALSRREDGNRENIIPKSVRTGENKREAVIEITAEGIYDIMATSADGKPAEATFVLKVHESGPGAKSRELGQRSVERTVTIARVLMPEGMLWDDDSSFTGNMEDSESVTKFNAETGLVWREYK